jgi:hypothetical protein
MTVLLPAGIQGTHYIVLNCGSAAPVTITPDGTELLFGVNANVMLTSQEYVHIHYDAVEGWRGMSGQPVLETSSPSFTAVTAGTVTGTSDLIGTIKTTSPQVIAAGAAGLQIRDDSGNNGINIADGGAITLVGGSKVEKHVTISAGSLRLATNPPAEAHIGTFALLTFSHLSTMGACFNFHMPPDWEVGTDVSISLYWFPSSTNAGIVAWEFDWEAVALGETAASGSTHVDIHDTVASSYSEGDLLETPLGVIAGGSLAVDDTVGISLTRDHNDAEDNIGGNAQLLHAKIKYTADKLGG